MSRSEKSKSLLSLPRKYRRASRTGTVNRCQHDNTNIRKLRYRHTILRSKERIPGAQNLLDESGGRGSLRDLHMHRGRGLRRRTTTRGRLDQASDGCLGTFTSSKRRWRLRRLRS